MTTKEREGYELMRGAMVCLGKYLVIGMAIVFLFGLVRNWQGWGVDDSDKDGWNRSGLRIHTDAKTGAQYLSDGNGGLVRREYR
jgi:hypothetical protein